jgi:hypothetical protein
VLHDVTCRSAGCARRRERWDRSRCPRPWCPVALTGLGFGLVVVGGVACGTLLGLWYSLAHIDPTGDRRLVKHGYDLGTLKRVLRERNRDEHADEIALHACIERLPSRLSGAYDHLGRTRGSGRGGGA